VVLPKLGRKAQTDQQGRFQFDNVPAGTWEVLAHLHALSDRRKAVQVTAGGVAETSFELSLSPVQEQISVTASGREETALETFVPALSVSSLELAGKSSSTSLGDLLDNQPGVAKRSFGPGTTRPVIRGFDGDRVLVLEDGVRTGSLSAQSGDHGEPLDPAQVERIEVVRGPATLLYGSNAIGGVINAVSPQHDLHEKPHPGPSGSATATGGSPNGQASGGGNLRYGIGSWQIWGGSGGTRTGDYSTPIGVIGNSHSRLTNGRLGVGRFSNKASWSFGYAVQDGRYGIPSDDDHEAAQEGHGEVDLAFRRHQTRFTGSIREAGWLDQISLKLNYTDWSHRELKGDEIGTLFSNKQFVYRGEVQQKRRGVNSGTFGIWGMTRDFKATGEEALSPPVQQTAFALFAVEQFDFDRVRLQFGGRVERNRHEPVGLNARSFTGFSGSAGINVPLWTGGVAVANLTEAYRAPSLEELYFNGPHAGSGLFEVGNSLLKRERSLGLDLSLRQQSRRVRGELNYFNYRLSDFIYYAPTGRIENGLPEAEVFQAGSRYTGMEARIGAALTNVLWINASLDTVRAELRATSSPLPRIPPVRARIGLDLNKNGWSVRPELVLANHQQRIFETETATAGYAVPNLTASYSIAKQHALHVFGVNTFNLSNRLYRNHLSLIKEFAPEIGRGVRFSYTLHFY
jgi:iron complex outermembrane receptor protein